MNSIVTKSDRKSDSEKRRKRVASRAAATLTLHYTPRESQRKVFLEITQGLEGRNAGMVIITGGGSRV
jgi:hypothetical protein